MTDFRFPPPPPLPPSPPSPPMAAASEAELHAYADQRLTPERAAGIEAWLAERPDEAARVRAWGDQRHELRALFDPVLDEAVPASLRQAALRRASPRGTAWLRHPVAAGIAFGVALGAAGGVGWALRGAQDVTTSASDRNDTLVGAAFATRAAVAHAVYAPDAKRPVEVDAEHEDQLVKWLSKRMGAAMKAPHLRTVGYTLEGGRLLPGERGPVAQFMYRDDAGHRLTVYVSNDAASAVRSASSAGAAAQRSSGLAASPAQTGFRFLREGGLNVFTWVDGPFRYAITAASERPLLERVSEEVYRQLDVETP